MSVRGKLGSGLSVRHIILDFNFINHVDLFLLATRDFESLANKNVSFFAKIRT